MAAGGRRWSRGKKVAPPRGAVKTSPPYRSRPSARCAVADECWEMVARGGTRCTLTRDTFGLGGDMMASLSIFFFFLLHKRMR